MFTNEDEMPSVLTLEEARDYLFVSRNTLMSLLHAGIIKGFKVGNRWRIRKEDLLNFSSKNWCDK